MWRKWLPFLAVLAMRIRFFFSPLTTDEGGYLAVARAWFHGADLYGRVWVDRPQGLLVIYGILDKVGLGNTFGIRLLAYAACCLAMLACGHAAWILVGEKARLPVIWAVGISLSLAQIEGFIANAELLSCAIGSVALAAALLAAWNRENPDLRLLFVAGLAGGLAVSVKQSGFDALAAGCVAVLITTVHEKWGVRRFLRAVVAIVTGVAVPVGLMLVHAGITGFHDWWFAVAGVRLEHKSALAAADWHKLRVTAGIVAPLVAVAFVVGAALMTRMLRTHARAIGVLAAWSIVATVAFLMGGLFHRHYWVILMVPFGTIVGVSLSTVRQRSAIAALVAACLVVPVIATVRAVRMDDQQVATLINDDARLTMNEDVARWFKSQAPEHGTVWAMCASSALYALIDQPPPFRYSWFAYFAAVPEALPSLYEWLEGPDAPEYVVAVQSATRCDPSGKLGFVIANRYGKVGSVDRREILVRNGV